MKQNNNNSNKLDQNKNNHSKVIKKKLHKNKRTKKKKPYTLQVKELHKNFIDEWFNNGYNAVKAIQTVNPGISYSYANTLSRSILKAKNIQPYIEQKRSELKEATGIQTEQVLKELITYAYSDATDYVGLTKEELRELPPEVRRCIQGTSTKRRTFKDNKGNTTIDEVITIKLIDKVKAIEMINKHIGFYEEDNKQKKSINIESLNTDQLNVLLQIAEAGI